MNKRPDSDPIVLEDIDPTSDWVVESCPPEFDPDEDLDELEHVGQLQSVQLNADPNPPASVSQLARTPVEVEGASSAQPRQKHSRISTLSQRASAAQPASGTGTTSTVAVMMMRRSHGAPGLTLMMMIQRLVEMILAPLAVTTSY